MIITMTRPKNINQIKSVERVIRILHPQGFDLHIRDSGSCIQISLGELGASGADISRVKKVPGFKSACESNLFESRHWEFDEVHMWLRKIKDEILAPPAGARVKREMLF